MRGAWGVWGFGAAAGPAVPPSPAVPNRLMIAHPCPTTLQRPAGAGTRPGGLTLRGVGLSMASVAGSRPWLHPTLLPALFLFFNLMLLWVLSCLYENKNNLRASASAQPLPKGSACTRGLSPAPHPPKCNDPGPRPLPVPRGWGFLALQPCQTGICAYSRGYLNGAATS